MKKTIYLMVATAMALTVASCNNNDNIDEAAQQQDLELRAETLGYPDAETYQLSVAEQCAAGNHQNCDVLPDGTHQPCTDKNHNGTKHDGSHHNGNHHNNNGGGGGNHH